MQSSSYTPHVRKSFKNIWSTSKVNVQENYTVIKVKIKQVFNGIKPHIRPCESHLIDLSSAEFNIS